MKAYGSRVASAPGAVRLLIQVHLLLRIRGLPSPELLGRGDCMLLVIEQSARVDDDYCNLSSVIGRTATKMSVVTWRS